MNTPLDRVKLSIRDILSHSYKTYKNNIPEDEWKEYESWFWKIRRLVDTDVSPYINSIRIYEEDNIEKKVTINNKEEEMFVKETI
jgi:hypothetical protein